MQRRREPDQLVGADTDTATFEAEIDVVDRGGAPDFRGPFVQGRPGDRFVYLTWGELHDEGEFVMFRRTKLMLDGIKPAVLAAAAEPGHRLEARLGLSDDWGLPRCAAVRPPLIEWTATGV